MSAVCGVKLFVLALDGMDFIDNVNTPLEVNIEKIIQIVERLTGR